MHARNVRFLAFPILFILLVQGCTQPVGKVATRIGSLDYPQTRTVDQVDVFHGVAVADPYRWLEDENAPETKQWIEAENKVTFGYLEQISFRKPIKKRLTALWDYEKYGIPRQEAGRYFFSKNDGLQNQSVQGMENSAS